jgi:ABC-type glycerol-3-phosphate transport system substrate-binding protein
MHNNKLPFYILILLLILSSCRKQDTISEQVTIVKNYNAFSSSNQQLLRIMGHWYGEGKKELLVREAVREFSLLNQDLTIDLQFPHQIFKFNDEAELYFIECDSIEQMIKLNKWPFDVLFCDKERYRLVSERVNDKEWGKKYLVDFSQESWFQKAHKDGLFETLHLSENYGGILPGPIIEGITHILFVSEEVEKKIGLKVKDFDMTYDDFLSYAKIVDEYNKTHSEKFTFFSKQYQYAIDNLFKQLVTSYYGKKEFSSYNESYAALDYTYKAFEELSKYHVLDQHMDYSHLAYDIAQRILFDKQCLFNLQPTWLILLWNKSNPEGLKKLRPCEIPSFEGKISPFYSGFFQVIFVVPKNSQNPEGGKRFIQFITTTETADKWVKYSKSPTGLKTSISYTDFGQNMYEKFFQHIQQKYGNNQMDVNLNELLFNTTKTIDFKYSEVLSGNLSASDAMKNIRKVINK